MSERMPYRFEATEGMHAGTTFIYYPGSVVSFRTEDPDTYFRTTGGSHPHTWRWPMTPEKLAEFRAVTEADRTG